MTQAVDPVMYALCELAGVIEREYHDECGADWDAPPQLKIVNRSNAGTYTLGAGVTAAAVGFDVETVPDEFWGSGSTPGAGLLGFATMLSAFSASDPSNRWPDPVAVMFLSNMWVRRADDAASALWENRMSERDPQREDARALMLVGAAGETVQLERRRSDPDRASWVIIDKVGDGRDVPAAMRTILDTLTDIAARPKPGASL